LNKLLKALELAALTPSSGGAAAFPQPQRHKEEAMETIVELITSMAHSTPAGFVGVSGIFVFLAVMVGGGLYRVKQAMEHEEHH
jgi:hypothetical protein